MKYEMRRSLHAAYSRPLLQKLIAVYQVNDIIRVKVSYFGKRTKGVITQLHSSSEHTAKHTKV